MAWFLLSLLGAALFSLESTAVKKCLGDLPPLHMAAIPLFHSLPVFLAGLLLLPQPELTEEFWTTLLLLIPFTAAGYVLQIRALHLSPLSLSLPLLAFTPAFVMVTGRILLGENISVTGAVGIMVIIAGSYVLNLEAMRGSWWRPFRALAFEPGSRCMLGASLAYSVSSVLGKKTVVLTSPLYATALFFCLFNLSCLCCFLAMRQIRFRDLLVRPRAGMGTALFLVAHNTVHNLAVALAPTAYMIAIKRLSGLFSVLLGRYALRETGIRFRLAGSVLMAAGAGLIAIGG